MSLVISDTTPLHYLILLGQVDLLRQLFGTLLVPPAVIREMRHEKAPPMVSAWADKVPSWVEIRAPQFPLALRLGPGESEAIALAAEIGGAALLVDDREARKEARKRGLVTFGTIALLDLADERGLLDFEQVASQLLATTFHVEEEILAPFRAKARTRKASQ